MKKKVFVFALLLVMLSLLTVPIGASSYKNSHHGTYSMTGGIFYKQAFDNGTKMQISVYPETGTWGCNMGIYTAKKYFLFGWWDADYINSVSSMFPSETLYTTTEAIDGIYFKDWAGDRWKGTFVVEW